MTCVFRVGLGVLGVALALPAVRAQSAAVQELYQQAHEAQEAGDAEKAIASYRELLRKDPSVAAAYNNLGRLYYNLNRFGEAADVLRRGVALKPDMAPAQVMLGASYLQLNEPGKAIEPLQRGLKAMPEDAFARQMLTQALLRANRTAEATAQLQKQVAADPKDQQSWYLLGKLELKLSEEAFARMRAVDPNSPLAHQLSGEIMESMQNTPGAIAEYKQALAVDPNDAEAMGHLANVYWSTGDWAAARPAYTGYLAKRPGDCDAEWKLANTLDQTGAPPDEVLAHASAAVEHCPDLPQAKVERARALLKENKPTEALTDLKAAEAKSPQEPSVQFLLARAYRAVGSEAEAKTAMARFQELDKAQHEAQEKHAAEVLSANH